MEPHPASRVAALTTTSRVGPDDAADDVFAHFRPPFDLTSDMLLGLALCPTPPLRRAFPSVPFLSVRGRTPLVIWFARITDAHYYDEDGKPRSATETGQVPYNELNVLALLRQRAVFVPGIYATSRLSVRIGLGYGMPKRMIEMDVQRSRRRITAAAIDGVRRSAADARLEGSGKILAWVLSNRWPMQTWSVRFPSGSEVRPLILEVPRAQVARLRNGRLAVEARWLPGPVSLLPVGLYLPGLRMRLPPPASPGRLAARPASGAQHGADRSGRPGDRPTEATP